MEFIRSKLSNFSSHVYGVDMSPPLSLFVVNTWVVGSHLPVPNERSIHICNIYTSWIFFARIYVNTVL